MIRVESLGKKYIIGHQKQERFTALQDAIANRATGLFRGEQSQVGVTEEFWALKDVSLPPTKRLASCPGSHQIAVGNL